MLKSLWQKNSFSRGNKNAQNAFSYTYHTLWCEKNEHFSDLVDQEVTIDQFF